MPTFLGILLTLGSVGYLLDSFGRLLFAGGGSVAALVPACMVVSTVAELAMVGWLLIVGFKTGASTGAAPGRDAAA